MGKSVVTSEYGKRRYEDQTGEKQQYDVDECQELGIMSAEHFQDFMKFCKK